MTRPANTVGGDFYDIVPLPDGRVLLALGDVAGKGSPAALLMALLLAMMRTLIDEGLEGADLVTRLNVQIGRYCIAALSFRDALHCDPQSRDRRVVLRQRGTEPSPAAPWKWLLRTAARRRDGSGDVRERHLHHGRDAYSNPATSW